MTSGGWGARTVLGALPFFRHRGRDIALPPGAAEPKVSASYADGVLEVRVPTPPEPKSETTKIPVSRG